MGVLTRAIAMSACVMLMTLGLASCSGGGNFVENSTSTPPPPTPPPAPAPSAFPLKVGDVGPIATDNPRQQPFVCMTQETDLGKAIVDNQDGTGDQVTDAGGKPIGFSADCGAGMNVSWYYRATGDAEGDHLHKYDLANPPSDVKTITVDGKTVPLIIRHEEGVINRFIYSISLLSSVPDRADVTTPDLTEWNGDAVFYFIGGVGVGHTQSYSGNALRAINDVGTGQTGALALLERGYAIINSTGAAASTTYNLKLMGQTAHMVKQQFVAAYGQPDHTFGLGASGGAVQQFAYAQNDADLIDALIPVQPFPDMITQVNPVGDCELLHHYFDVTDAQVNGSGAVDPKWTTWGPVPAGSDTGRQMVVGLHGVDLYDTSDPRYAKLAGSDATQIIQATSSAKGHVGADVCMTEWFGAVPQFFNPLWGSEGSYDRYYDQTVWDRTPISFFDDLVDIFGTIPNTNLARSTYDNVGVQYGLQALKRGKITADEFLDINAHVGGWVSREDMVEPGYPFEGGPGATGENIDPWSARNATAKDHTNPTDVAPRSQGSVDAMQAAYQDGLVFMGKVDKPIIIIEPYLEPELNEHASREPFAVRQRLIDANGNADNLAIWMLAADDDATLTSFVLKAIHAETEWLDTHNRPATVQNGCYDTSGSPIAEGPGVFKGEVSADGSEVLGGMEPATDPGACTRQFPIYSDARVQSGLNVSDRVFKCALKSVGAALNDGTYGNVKFTISQQSRLYQIFQRGVCDYSKPGQGLPPGF